MKGRISMNLKELEIARILTEVEDKRLKQSKASRKPGMRPRYLRRLLRVFRLKGSKVVISRKIGRFSNYSFL